MLPRLQQQAFKTAPLHSGVCVVQCSLWMSLLVSFKLQTGMKSYQPLGRWEGSTAPISRPQEQLAKEWGLYRLAVETGSPGQGGECAFRAHGSWGEARNFSLYPQPSRQEGFHYIVE